MKPHYDKDGITIYNADCLETMKLFEDNSIDSIVTDPPYGLEFMGKDWDKGVPGIHFWQEMKKILKPGGHLLSFGGSRTYHRMACAIEDAGFEIRDQIMWVYGSGFPKSLNIGKAVDKKLGNKGLVKEKDIAFIRWLREGLGEHKMSEVDAVLGTKAQAFHYFALSDSNRQIPTGVSYKKIKDLLGLSDKYDDYVKEKNLELTDVREVKGYEKAIKTWNKPYMKATLGGAVFDEAKQWEGWGTALKPAHEPIVVARKPLSEKSVADNVLKWGTGGINIDGCRVGIKEKQGMGRFPANFIHDGSDEVMELFPNKIEGKDNFRHSATSIFGSKGKDSSYNGNNKSTWGSAARFFYCAKASKAERNMGLEGFEEKREADRIKDDGVGGENPRNRSNKPKQNHHPTVKPIKLMQYLIKLVTPKDGIVLDPFLGSGTTLIAAKQLGRKAVGIEISEEYCKIAVARIKAVQDNLFTPKNKK